MNMLNFQKIAYKLLMQLSPFSRTCQAILMNNLWS